MDKCTKRVIVPEALGQVKRSRIDEVANILILICQIHKVSDLLAEENLKVDQKVQFCFEINENIVGNGETENNIFSFSQCFKVLHSQGLLKVGIVG